MIFGIIPIELPEPKTIIQEGSAKLEDDSSIILIFCVFASQRDARTTELSG